MANCIKTESFIAKNYKIYKFAGKTRKNMYITTIFGKFHGKFAAISYFATQKSDVFTREIIGPIEKKREGDMHTIFVFINTELSENKDEFKLDSKYYVNDTVNDLCNGLFKDLTQINMITCCMFGKNPEQIDGLMTPKTISLARKLFEKYSR